MIVQSCKASKAEILAGDEVQLEITLLNTSSTEDVRNMTVTVSEGDTYLELLSATDTIYVDRVPAGETCVVSYTYKIQAATPEGRYDLSVAMDYADSKGSSQSGSGKVRMTVGQPVNVEFDALVLASEVEVADVVSAQVQVMNLGRTKVRNVRAVIEADGLIPEGTLFIGDIEAGTTASGSVKISVTSLSGGNALYGETKGKVTYYYEDEAGKSYEKSAEFVTNIKSPFSNTENKASDDTGQWWVIMSVIVGILAGFGVFAALQRIRRKKQDESEDI
jgi:hypothetical protein